LRSAPIGRTGNAYIVNREYVFQSRPCSEGRALGASAIDPAQFGGGVTVVEMTIRNGDKRRYAGSWLKENKQSLVINQCPIAFMTSLFALRRTEVPIILINAIDAIGTHGKIEAVSRYSGDKILVTIEDDGPGLSDDMLRKVFDPFFTTKDPGKGTGLGLWVSHNIIWKMGGSIHVLAGPWLSTGSLCC
jgi:hypothetical protein